MDNLIYFEMPESVTWIGSYCFNSDPKLFNSQYLNSGLQSGLDAMFKNITNIGGYSFINCGLSGIVNFSHVLNKLGTLAFNNAGMTGITFGSSGHASQLTEVGDRVFNNCYNVTALIYYSDISWDSTFIPTFNFPSSANV
jgi:hypothetical protein